MKNEGILAFTGPTAYLLAILVLLFIVLKGLPWSRLEHHRIGYLFVVLAAASFVHTFYYILVFYTASFAEYEARAGVSSPDLMRRLTAWLAQASLFEEAWLKASASSVNWWWSEQICTYAIGPWTVFLFVEGKQHHIKNLWAYMLLGQLVAISVPANLFYLALILSGRDFRTGPSDRSTTEPVSVPGNAPPVLWISILLSLVTVANSPYTDSKSFLPNLLLMHALIVVPFLLATSSNERKSHSGRLSISYSAFYKIMYAVILALRVKTVLATFREGSDGFSKSYTLNSFLRDIITALHSHPGQATIGWDVIWSTSSFVVWTCLDQGISFAPFSAVFASAGLVSSWIAAEVASTEELRTNASRKND